MIDWSTANHAKSFQLFSQRLQLYFTAKKIPEAEQTAHILLQVGEEGLRHFISWALSEKQQMPVTILDRFKEQLETEKFQDCSTQADGIPPETP